MDQKLKEHFRNNIFILYMQKKGGWDIWNFLAKRNQFRPILR